MELCAFFPTRDIGTDPAKIRDWAQAAEGLAVLLSEQNATWALALAQRAVILELGKVTMTGDAHALLEDPNVRKAYLGI